MQIFIPYPDPYLTAQCLDRKRLNKQIIEANIILQKIVCLSGSWSNHPVVKMYTGHLGWVQCYLSCLRHYAAGELSDAGFWAAKANQVRPPFFTPDLCDQHKRRLYTKAPDLYPQFEKYGESYENWYVIDRKIVRYMDGKLLKDD